MINGKSFLYWYKTKCYIENGMIKEKDYHNRTAYFIENTSSLLQDFIKIDITKSEDIIHFVNNYGFLKQEYPTSLGEAFESDGKWYTLSTYSEDVDYFKEQVLNFKSLRILHEVYTSDKPINALLRRINSIQWPFHVKYELMQKTQNYLDVTIRDSIIKDIKIKKQEYFEGMEYSTSTFYDEKNLKLDAAYILIKILNEQIKNIYPVLNLSDDFSDINSHLKTNSLLEVLYVKYYETIINGKEIRLCANERCTRDKYFEAIIGKEKKYCSPECAVQGIQNENYKEIRNPNSDKYSPAKIKFDKKYQRLYYLDYHHKKIDKEVFDKWNEVARNKLKCIKNGTLSDADFIDWLNETGKEENFLLEK